MEAEPLGNVRQVPDTYSITSRLPAGTAKVEPALARENTTGVSIGTAGFVTLTGSGVLVTVTGRDCAKACPTKNTFATARTQVKMRVLDMFFPLVAGDHRAINQP
jgi:hypothetical protein